MDQGGPRAMRINGKEFLLLLGVLTLAFAVATVWLWPRLAGRTWRPVLGRVGLLLGTQLTLAATFLFTINALGGFYTSWAQLFGTASSKYTVKNQGAAQASAADQHALSLGNGGQGELKGLRSGVDVGLTVYTPADYSSPADAHKTFPVAVLDVTGDSGLTPAQYQQAADTYQVIVAAVGGPGNAPVPGVNVPHGVQGELFWSQDLRTALTTRYRVAQGSAAWGVAGMGQAGTTAIDLAVQDSNRYGLAAAGGDWTHGTAATGFPGLETYLSSVPTPAIRLLYDPSSGAVPAKLAKSDGPLQVATAPGLVLSAELTWLGESMDLTRTGATA